MLMNRLVAIRSVLRRGLVCRQTCGPVTICATSAAGLVPGCFAFNRSNLTWLHGNSTEPQNLDCAASRMFDCAVDESARAYATITPAVRLSTAEDEGDGDGLGARVRAIANRAGKSWRGLLEGLDMRLQSAEGRTILGIIATNVSVFAMWKVVPSSFMVRHFASSLEAMRRGRVWTAVTANFSHMGLFHLCVNMYLLDMFGHDVARILGCERFTVLYIAGGIAACLTSLTSRRVLRNNVLSLGASGSVMATMFMFANLFPDRDVYLFGIWKIHAKDAMVMWALVDAAGLLGSFGKIDFAAHLGGGAFSYGYYLLIREKLSREYVQRKYGRWQAGSGRKG